MPGDQQEERKVTKGDELLILGLRPRLGWKRAVGAGNGIFNFLCMMATIAAWFHQTLEDLPILHA
jgi:hypothetical protein